MISRRHFLGAGAAAAAAYATGSFLPVWAQNAPDLGTPTFPQPGHRRVRVGDAEVVALLDGIARRPLVEGFVKNAPLADVQAALAAQGLPTQYIDVPFTPFLIVVGGKRVLMDTGLGEFGGPTAGKLIEQLRGAGVAPGDIDVVLVSHFHGDHINGLRNKAGDLMFPKAKVMVPEAEFAFWMDDARMNAAPEGMKGAFQGVRRVFGGMGSDRLSQFQTGTEVLPGIRTLAAYGHTPGHTVFEVNGGSQRFNFVADITNVPALFARRPDWAVMFDMDAEAAQRARRATFDRIIDAKAMLGGYHFPFPAIGTMRREGTGYAFSAAA
ncbi:MAG: hypothetical protein RL375_4102 [Pseudomonadota bacterium]